MKYTLEALLSSDENITKYYEEAKLIWEDFFKENSEGDVAAWAKKISSSQFRFENQCGGRTLGQEVMAWSAFALTYSTREGWGEGQLDLAEKLLRSFATSMCSVEVKAHARRAAVAYHLNENEQLAGVIARM